jgi:hypothetical protein
LEQWSWVPTGPEYKIYCPGEGKQQFNQQNNKLVVGHARTGKNVRKEAEDVVATRHQATTGEDTAD